MPADNQARANGNRGTDPRTNRDSYSTSGGDPHNGTAAHRGRGPRSDHRINA